MLTDLEQVRFWNKVTKTESCWIWNAATRNGYGAFKARYVVWSAHRLSWEIHNGKIPDDREICHTCDNRLCVNPKHMFLGTRKDNMQDAVNKGRISRHRAKVSDEAIRQIRYLNSQGIGVRLLAQQFGLAKSNVQNIVNRVTYKHIT